MQIAHTTKPFKNSKAPLVALHVVVEAKLSETVKNVRRISTVGLPRSP